MYKVLLADDEYLEREAMKLILYREMQNIEIVGEATTGSETIDMCRELQPDILFMDMKIPGIHGQEAAKIIKSTDREPVIILMTAYVDTDKAGDADDYLLKPARPKDIVQIIQKHSKTKTMKTSSTEEKINDLLQQIHIEDYKEAKERLEVLVNHLLSSFKDNQTALATHVQGVARNMLEIFEMKGLPVESSSNLLQPFLHTIHPYKVKEKLSMVLDQIFEKIIHHPNRSKNEFQTILNYIEKYFDKGITLDEVAEYAHLSPYYLSKLFKKELDINFVDYVVHRKMEKAKELLENTNLPVSNIALEISYQEANYFSKVFKKVVGMTPSEYREKNEKQKAKTGLIQRYNHISNGKWFI